MNVGTLALGTIATLLAGSLVWRWASRHRQLPCPSWLAWILDNPWTQTLGGTQATLDRIGLQSGERGLDVGCGPGRLTVPAAQRVGSTGAIVAVDVQPAMLERLERRASAAGVTNIKTCLDDISAGESLPTNGFDRAWLVTVLGEIPDQRAALRTLYRVLRPGGTLSITEVLPDPHYQSRGTVLRLCQEAGFVPTRHWGNVFTFTQNFVRLKEG